MLRTTKTHRTSSGTLLGYTVLHDSGTEQYYAWTDLAEQIRSGVLEITGLRLVSQSNTPDPDASAENASAHGIEHSDVSSFLSVSHDEQKSQQQAKPLFSQIGTVPEGNEPDVLTDDADNYASTDAAKSPSFSAPYAVPPSTDSAHPCAAPAGTAPITGEIIHIVRSDDGRIRGYNLLVRGEAMYFTGAELKQRLLAGELTVDGLYVNDAGKLTLTSGSTGDLLHGPAILVKKRKKVVVIKKKAEQKESATQHAESDCDVTGIAPTNAASGETRSDVPPEKAKRQAPLSSDALSGELPSASPNTVLPSNTQSVLSDIALQCAAVVRIEPKGVPVNMPAEQRTDGRKAFIKRRFL